MIDTDALMAQLRELRAEITRDADRRGRHARATAVFLHGQASGIGLAMTAIESALWEEVNP